MSIMQGGRRQEPLNVGLMALALALAAFTGAALGLVWQSAGFGGEYVGAGDDLGGGSR